MPARRPLREFLLLVNNPPRFLLKHGIRDPRLAAGIFGLAALWRRIASIQPELGEVASRLFINLEDAAEILDRERGIGWNFREVKNLRAQYHAAVLDHMEAIADQHVQSVIPLWLSSLEQFAGRLNSEQASELLRWTEAQIAKIVPPREILFRQRWAICPLCSRVFVRSTQKRAQKYCDNHRNLAPKERLTRTARKIGERTSRLDLRD